MFPWLYQVIGVKTSRWNWDTTLFILFLASFPSFEKVCRIMQKFSKVWKCVAPAIHKVSIGFYDFKYSFKLYFSTGQRIAAASKFDSSHNDVCSGGVTICCFFQRGIFTDMFEKLFKIYFDLFWWFPNVNQLWEKKTLRSNTGAFWLLLFPR